MKLVLDASAALAAAMGPAKPLVAEIVGRADVVSTPELFVAEVTNGLWKYVAMRDLSIGAAIELLATALDLVDGFHDLAELAEDALREAARHRHPVYDLYYAVLARREGAAILTFDRRLKELCSEMGIPLADA
jgi:predicted nucleic acid-binding protein